MENVPTFDQNRLTPQTSINCFAKSAGLSYPNSPCKLINNKCPKKCTNQANMLQRPSWAPPMLQSGNARAGRLRMIFPVMQLSYSHHPAQKGAKYSTQTRLMATIRSHHSNLHGSCHGSRNPELDANCQQAQEKAPFQLGGSFLRPRRYRPLVPHPSSGPALIPQLVFWLFATPPHLTTSPLPHRIQNPRQ